MIDDKDDWESEPTDLDPQVQSEPPRPLPSDPEGQLLESGATKEDIEIIKTLFGDEILRETKPLEDIKSDKYGEVTVSKRGPAITYREHDPNVDTIYVDIDEAQYFGDIPHYANFVRSQIQISIAKQRALIIRTNERTVEVLSRLDPTIFEDGTVVYD